MPVTDPIADLLTRIRNAQRVRHASCTVPWSRHKQEICEVLKGEGYLAEVQLVEGAVLLGAQGEAKGAQHSKNRWLILHFSSEKPPLTLERVSKPGRRIYRGRRALKPILQGLGLAILSTSEGIMTDREARKRGIGGEVLCTLS